MIAWKDAWVEVRRHLGRFVVIAMAVAMAVGLFVATQVYVATYDHAEVVKKTLWAQKADVIGWVPTMPSGYVSDHGTEVIMAAAMRMRQDPRIEAVEFQVADAKVVLSNGKHQAEMSATTLVTSPSLRTYTLLSGSLPRRPMSYKEAEKNRVSVPELMKIGYQVALSRDAAEEFGIKAGDKLHLPEGGDREPLPVTVTGIIDQPLTSATVYLPPYEMDPDAQGGTAMAGTRGGTSRWLASLKNRKNIPAVVNDLRVEHERTGQFTMDGQYASLEEFRELTAGKDQRELHLSEWVAMGFGIMAFAVGAMVTLNTLTLLIARRRRQIGLLRAVGGTASYVWWQLAWEALMVGFAGALLGLGAGIGAGALVSKLTSSSIDYGLTIPWVLVLCGVAAGPILTLVASLLPLRTAMMVKPVEAMNASVDAEPTARRRLFGILMAVGLMAVGVSVAAWSMSSIRPGGGLVPLMTAGAGALVTLAGCGVGAAVLLPWTLHRVGSWVGKHHTEAAISAANLRRNPRRVAATTSVVLIAVSLIVGLQVVAAIGRRTAEEYVESHYPIDITIQPNKEEPDTGSGESKGPKDREDGKLRGFRPGVLDRVKALPGVADAGLHQVSQPAYLMSPSWKFGRVSLAAMDDDVRRLSSHPIQLDDNAVCLPREEMDSMVVQDGEQLRLILLQGSKVSLAVTSCQVATSIGFVSPKTMTDLQTPTRDGLLLVKVTPGVDDFDVLTSIQTALKTDHPFLVVSGALPMKRELRAYVDSLLWSFTGLAALVALIALMGMSNTLSLSVTERRSEFAVLRTMGLTKGGLRRLLAWEALLMGVVALVWGCVLGLALGWFAASVARQAFGYAVPSLSVDVVALAVVALVTLAATCAASLLAGHRAAAVSPVAGLADAG